MVLARRVVQDETGGNIIRFVSKKVTGYHWEKALKREERYQQDQLGNLQDRAEVMITSLFL